MTTQWQNLVFTVSKSNDVENFSPVEKVAVEMLALWKNKLREP